MQACSFPLALLLTQQSSCYQASYAKERASSSHSQQSSARHPQGKQLHIWYASWCVWSRHDFDCWGTEVKPMAEARKDAAHAACCRCLCSCRRTLRPWPRHPEAAGNTAFAEPNFGN
jgi:hypothetical protein